VPPVGATLYVQTSPGASCTASLALPGVTGFNPGPQIALVDGFTVFPFLVNTSATSGTATAVCTLNGQSITTTTTFTLIHFLPTATPGPTDTPTPVPTATGIGSQPQNSACSYGPGVQVGAAVSDPVPQRQEDVTVSGCITKDGKPVFGVPMHVVAHFRDGDQVCDYGVSNAQGVATCLFNTGNTPSDFTVTIDVDFLYQGQHYTASTSFTPSYSTDNATGIYVNCPNDGDIDDKSLPPGAQDLDLSCP
jgi:hypothetical protein